MEKASIYQPFGASSHTESSWPDALSEAHRGYVLAYIEFELAKEAAAIDEWLSRAGTV